ncbi:uncharacterized protein LOC115553220 isoform X1 [Gadus morhua]|uniref:uncharacterized protein LOC115553220 isoform X1 n=1 Tax=Gadus morhua TaxID=8049 RepID=UPI0011B47E6B|nr:uncharacterized protein LOC115553220 isoform X1 [Gadus morhua]
MEITKESGEGTSLPAEWSSVSEPARAAWLFSKELLQRNKHLKSLYLNVDVRKERQQQDNALITFYKRPCIQWASPVICELKGDCVTGPSACRHLFSTVIFKLRSGLHFNLEDAVLTKVFEGETDHLVPSTSEALVSSEVFTVAGRMVGHSFLHGGPSLPGISPAVLHVLFGGSPESAPVTLEDCPDMEIRDSITLLDSNNKAEFCDSISSLCMSWNLPAPNVAGRNCLSKQLLQHAVLGRTMTQTSCFRRGLEETGVWPLLTQRPDVVPLLFPRESEAQITSHMLLDHIVWPSAITVIYENYMELKDDEDEEEDKGDICRISGYLRMFIENASSAELKSLLKFWTGWEMPAEKMKVEILDAALPSSLACFEKLRLPRHYVKFNTFRDELQACLSTVHSSFEFS